MIRPLVVFGGLAFSILPAAELPPAVLDHAAAVRSLPAETAATARPVKLRGNLLLVTVSRGAMVLQDGAEGIYVELPRQVSPDYQLGDELEVIGTTAAGDFAPIVRASEVRRLGPGAVPPPRPSSIAELNAGGLDAAWVELRGVVRSCVPTPADRMPVARSGAGEADNLRDRPGPAESWLMTFAQGDDKTEVLINGPLVPRELIDAEVRLRAVVFNVHNANRQFVRANLQVPGRAQIKMVAPPPAEPIAKTRKLAINAPPKANQTNW